MCKLDVIISQIYSIIYVYLYAGSLGLLFALFDYRVHHKNKIVPLSPLVLLLAVPASPVLVYPVAPLPPVVGGGTAGLSLHLRPLASRHVAKDQLGRKFMRLER